MTKHPQNVSGRFIKKWDRKAIKYIIDSLNNMTDVIDVQYYLAKNYNVSLRATDNWIEMVRSMMKDLNNGLDFDKALDRAVLRERLKRSRKNEA